MWFWAISAISGSILGSATSSWFEKTAMGRWFYKKVENVYNWSARRYGFEVLKAEDKWQKKYPNIAAKILELEMKIKRIESSDGYTEYGYRGLEEIKTLEGRIKKMEENDE